MISSEPLFPVISDNSGVGFSGGDIELASASIIYFGDATTDGTWRIRVSSGNLVFELRESGTYNEKSAVIP